MVTFRDDYVGPAYNMTSSVINLRKLPRFGYDYDITAVISPNQAAQVNYTTGLVVLFLFLFVIFVFWTITLLVFKLMGPGNAGFLSGYPFVIPDPVDDKKNIRKRPFRVRIVFLVASALLMLFSFLFVILGVANVNNATASMGVSIQTADQLVQDTNQIAGELAKVGNNSIELRDAAVAQLQNICPANPNLADVTGVDIMPIAEKAKSDLTMLATFIGEGLATLNEALTQISSFLNSADDKRESLDFWGWQMKLVAAGLFILPFFLIIGVGLVMLGFDVKAYQKALTYLIMPLFTLTVIVTYVFCSITLPAAAASADACTGGGQVHGGPDDTLLTIYRNLRGDDNGIVFLFLAFYTQRCLPQYYPFDIIERYYGDLDTAVDSTASFVKTIGDNLILLQQECGKSFDEIQQLVKDINLNLVLLQDQAIVALDKFQCKNINDLYVNTVYETGCTYSVDAIAWMFACSLIISVCGLIMIMLRSSFYPVQHLGMSSEWITKQATAKSESFDSQSSKQKTPDTLASGYSDPASPPIKQSTPSQMLFEFDLESVECSQQRSQY